MNIALIEVSSIAILVIMPILILWIRDKLFDSSPSNEELEAERIRFESRLRSPDLDAVAAHYGCSLPAALCDLYANLDEVMRSDFEVIPPGGTDPIEICSYNPADTETLRSPWPGCEKYFAFADDGGGNQLLLNPALDDPPVLWHDHETGEFESVAQSMTEFMKWPRRPWSE